jgi:hypothetical protein
MPKNEAFIDTTPQVAETQFTAPEWQWINIPERDLLDQPFGGIGLNLLHFGPSRPGTPCNCLNYPACVSSQQHKIQIAYAPEVQERLRIAQVADLRVFSGRRDMKALMELVSKGLANSGGQFKDPTEPGA